MVFRMNLIKKAIYGLATIIIALLVLSSIVKAAEVEITGDIINLRQEASTDSTIIIQIAKGEKCEFIEEEGNWYRVKYGDYTGYVSKDYAEMVTNSSSEESSNTESNNTTQEEENNKENNNVEDNKATEKESNEKENNTSSKEEQNANNSESSSSNLKGTGKTNKNTSVRIAPLINSSKIANLKNNSEVNVIEELNGWAYIQTDEISGWVRTNNITIDNDNNATDKPSDETNKQSTDSNKTSDSDKDNKDNSTDKNNSDDKDNTDKNNDNSNKDDNNSDFTKKTMYTTNAATNIRSEASTNSNIVMVVSINTALEVIGEEGEWYKVNTSEGDAYVSKDLLSNSKTDITNRGGIDRTSNSTNTSKKVTTENVSKKENASTSSSTKASEIVSYAKKFLGVPYVYGGASPSGFDCSGFTMYVYNHFGISMRHGAQAQAKLGEKVSANKSSKSSLLNNLKVGDLVFFLDYETMDEIGHCGIYIGSGNFIHASSGSGYCVKINSLLPGEYYNTRYCAARRIL